MNTVCDINMCAGCMLCSDICPQEAIVVQKSIMAYNAFIDGNKCVNCNVCHKMCQANHQPEFKESIFWAQGWSNDAQIRSHSASGGFATALEIAFVQMKGVVFSCTYHNGEFSFACAETVEDVLKFGGSKYVKSNPTGVYKKIKQLINDRRYVLFVGLPCQVAAVLNYCGVCDNLYTVDLICHGTPSPKLLFMYLGENNILTNSIKTISFRDKNQFRLKPNGRAVTNSRIQDFYTDTFLNGITYTENCYLCSYARRQRISDITLGDSWGSDLNKEEQVKGISLILAQSEKGIELIKNANLFLTDVSLEKAVENNYQLSHPAVKSPKRKIFFSEIEKRNSFCVAYRKAFPKQFIKDIVKGLMLKLHMLGE